jgi:nitroreductase
VDGSLGIGSLRDGGVVVPTGRLVKAAAPRQPTEAAPTPTASAPAPTSGSVIDVMLTRRSISKLEEPGPTAEQLETLLHAATTVPDHGGLRPWRFAVVRGAGRARFGDALAAAANDPAVRDKALAAPALIAVIAAPKLDSKIPEWEQTTSASSSGYAITLAAHGLGLGASWRSTEHMDGPALRELFGMAPTDRLLGWVNVGTPVEDAPPERREAPDLASLVTRVE